MEDLATYSISMEIKGMQVSGQPAGTGDRDLTFNLKFPANAPDAANELWYKHLEVLFGPEATEKLAEFARQMTK